MAKKSFPEDFAFGTATAAYQIGRCSKRFILLKMEDMGFKMTFGQRGLGMLTARGNLFGTNFHM